jgi:cytochrome c biogenesis protein CcmG/thiol:disulfide interchange protein DsbE
MEMPSFVQWQKMYGAQGLQVVGVSMDDSPADAENAAGKYGLVYPVLMGDAKLGELYGGVLGLPVTYLVDRQGIVRYRHEGVTSLQTLKREMNALLAAR